MKGRRSSFKSSLSTATVVAVVLVSTMLCLVHVTSAMPFLTTPIFSHLSQRFLQARAAPPSTEAAPPPGGGIPCIACTVIVTFLDQLSNLHNKSVEKVLDEVCDLFPGEAKTTCLFYVAKYGDAIVERIEQGDDPDEVCLQIKLCTDGSCRLNAPVKSPWAVRMTEQEKLEANAAKKVTFFPDPWNWLKNISNRFGNEHEPAIDLDNDLYSTLETFRGSNWRGKDCDDLNGNVHPGRAFDSSQDPNIDYNCNGIFGLNDNGDSYEETLCSSSSPMGVIAIGDSATAHFHIPEQWFNTSQMNSSTFDDLFFVAEMEVDWPHMSGYTGFLNDSMVDSIYLRMRERNLCNHRDYQNMGVNGARAGAVSPPNGIVNSIARNATVDNPALVFLSLIGNDVCDPHPDYENRMTTPSDFEASTLKTLEFLDTVLPNGSHVVFIGLANGSLLWDVLHDRLHPIGVTYADLYEYLICMQETPCFVWMNPNATIRDAGTNRAAELSAVYPSIIANYTFQNFDMEYYDFPLPAIAEIWESKGGELWQLIEPCDGFHPNQIANYYFAEVIWGYLERDHPDWLGPVNPNNQLIQSLFGDQGGY